VIPGSDFGAAVRRRAVDTLLRVEGGDESLIDRIKANRKFQEYLAQHDPKHPLRAVGEYAEKRLSSSTYHQHFTRMEDLEYEHKKQEIDDNRQNRLLQLEDEREGERLKRQLELTEMKDRLDVVQQTRRLDLEGDQQKRTFLCEEFTRDHLLKKAKFETDVRIALDKNEINQEAADQILGKQQRRLLLIPLGTIISNERLSEATRVCRNFSQRFRQKYQEGFFSPKPSTDWHNGVGSDVKWYEEDIPKIRELCELLIAEARTLPSGQRPLFFVA
jgi:hypothetical protein